jgi:Flp pilus assembly protein TadD
VLFARALQLDPKLSHAYYGKGAALTQMHQYEQALAEFDKAIALDRRNGKAWHNKGYALHKLGREDEAMQCIKSKYESMGIKNYVSTFSWED